MALIIKDGHGSGSEAKVGSDGRIHTDTVVRSGLADASLHDGSGFFLSTGFIPLTTTGSPSGILYFKNTTSSKRFRIYHLRTCGEPAQQWTAYKNPTTGTLISGAVAGEAANINFSAAGEYSGVVYKGADGNTITDGEHLTQWITGGGHTHEEYDGSIILAPGNSFALECQPGTAGDVCVSVLISEELI